MNLALIAILFIGQTTGKVVSVYDGDTITVRTSDATIKARLIHIDAPERGQAYGTRARQHLSELVFGKQVELIGTEKDRYGRLLAVVKVEGLEVNLEMVRSGMAWAYLEYKPPAEYIGTEQRARAGKVGLWADRQPIPPWEYRKQSRAKSKKAA